MAIVVSESELEKIGKSLHEMMPDLTEETNIWIGNRRYRILRTEKDGIWLNRWKAFPKPIGGITGAFETDFPIFLNK